MLEWLLQYQVDKFRGSLKKYISVKSWEYFKLDLRRLAIHPVESLQKAHIYELYQKGDKGLCFPSENSSLLYHSDIGFIIIIIIRIHTHMLHNKVIIIITFELRFAHT